MITEKLSGLELLEWEKSTGRSSLLDAGLWPDQLPSVSSWCGDIAMATIHQNTALFLHIISQIMLAHEARFVL